MLQTLKNNKLEFQVKILLLFLFTKDFIICVTSITKYLTFM